MSEEVVVDEGDGGVSVGVIVGEGDDDGDSDDVDVVEVDGGALGEVEEGDTVLESQPLVEEADEQEEVAPTAVNVSMEAGNFFFEPAVISVEAGAEVTVMFVKNSGHHTFVIDEIGVKQTIVEGESVTFTAPSEAGSYAFYCDIGLHRANGMEGVLVVK